jgi:hypothetical protein
MPPSNLELAAQIFWGEDVALDDCHVAAPDNPEAVCAFRDTLENLSKEAKLIATTILSLPDEVYLKTGPIVMYEVYSYMERRYKWPRRKVKKHCQELTSALGGNNAAN